MKIIINRGFDKLLTKIIVFKNEREVNACHFQNDYCALDAIEGDRIVVKLKFPDTSTVTIASFIYHRGNDIYYVYPTTLCKIWELLTYAVLPYTGLLLLALRAAINSEAYSWFCAAIIALTALSLVCLKTCVLLPSMRKRLLRLEILPVNDVEK